MKLLLSTFTFHYVSIKSTAYTPNTDIVLKFTFHYVSIKSSKDLMKLQTAFYLHSTMYLLNRHATCPQYAEWKDLHSTMYLLNRKRKMEEKKSFSIYIPLCIY